MIFKKPVFLFVNRFYFLVSSKLKMTDVLFTVPVNLLVRKTVSLIVDTLLFRFDPGVLSLEKEGMEHFPPPISKVISSTPLWKWSAVTDWMVAHKKLDTIIAQNAHLIEDINGALELRDGALVKRRRQWLKKIEARSVA